VITKVEDEDESYHIRWTVVGKSSKYERISHFLVVYYKIGGERFEIITKFTNITLVSLKKGSRYRIVITAITENMKQSESLIGDFETSKEIEDETSCSMCGCDYYKRSQETMQASINKLIDMIEILTEKNKEIEKTLNEIKQSKARSKKCRKQKKLSDN